MENEVCICGGIAIIIKLIQPKMLLRPMDTSLKTRMAPSLELLTIAQILRGQHQICIENENTAPLNFQQPVDLVAITVTVDTFSRAVEIAKTYRGLGVAVIAGGIHISSCPDECEPYFDAICIGPSETVWKHLLADLEAGQLQKRYACAQAMTASDIASPAYDLIDPSEYLYTNIIFTSYGCPYRCSFCYNSCEAYRTIYLHKPVEQVVREIKLISKKHILFIDDHFAGDPHWTKALLKAIEPLNIKWNAAVSVNIAETPDLLDQMKASGCQGLFIGFESLRDDVLLNAHKMQNHADKYEQLIGAIHDRGIMINASFVFGLDGEDASVFKNTVNWAVTHKIETITSHIFTPYPGTELYHRLLKEGRITCFDLTKYNTANVVFAPRNMTAQELYEGYLSVYKELFH